jgi:hypothetical protein
MSTYRGAVPAAVACRDEVGTISDAV